MDMLPPELEAHIATVSSDWFQSFEPRHRGATDDPFFAAAGARQTPPAVEARPANEALPPCLREIYCRFAPDTEFEREGVVFLSEDEILARKAAHEAEGQARMVDLAVAYAGMGHVHVISYDPVTGSFFRGLDGGSNGWDRAANHRDRLARDVDAIARDPDLAHLLVRTTP